MNFIFYIFSLIFLIINIFILYNDYKSKKIPNKYLGYLMFLLPIYGFLLSFLFSQNIELSFLVQFLMSFLATFGLYYYGIWGAGDAKYLLVLSFYLPHIGIVPFIGNIALITLTYLLIYFIFFYIKKIFLENDNNFIQSIMFDIKEKFKYKFIIKNSTRNIFYISEILKWFIMFSIVFITLRLLKFNFFDVYIIGNYTNIILKFSFLGFLKENPAYFFIVTIILIVLFYQIIMRIFRNGSLYIKNFIHWISNKFGFNVKNVNDIFLLLLSIIFLVYLGLEYIKDSELLLKHLYLIGTYYLLFYIVIKVLIYTYKITFQIGEENIITLNELKTGDIIDKKYLINLFKNENCLGAQGNKKGFMYPSPTNYISNLDNPIDKQGKKSILKAFQIVNKYHKEERNENNQSLTTIKTLKTFAFSGYIFLGFIITYFYQDTIFLYIFDAIKSIIKNLYVL